MGSIEIVTPEGIDVDLTGMSIMGRRSLQVHDAPVLRGSPRILIRAFPIMGEVKVSYADRLFRSATASPTVTSTTDDQAEKAHVHRKRLTAASARTSGVSSSLDEGFGHLVAAGKGRDVPVVVPTQFVLDGDEVILHLVGKNPILEAIEEQPRVLMSVAGDWAFIPSSWKAVGEEDPLLGIPTTYYAAVQIQGSATIVSDVGEVAAILRRQLVALQPGLEVADPLAAHEAQLSTIRGIRIVIEEVRAKFKYGGNVDVEPPRGCHRRPRATWRAGRSRRRPPDQAPPRRLTVSSPLQDWTRQRLAALRQSPSQASPRSFESASRASALSGGQLREVLGQQLGPFGDAYLLAADHHASYFPGDGGDQAAVAGDELEGALAEADPDRRGASLSPGHSILHRPFAVHLDHADRQEVRHRRRQHAVV